MSPEPALSARALGGRERQHRAAASTAFRRRIVLAQHFSAADPCQRWRNKAQGRITTCRRSGTVCDAKRARCSHGSHLPRSIYLGAEQAVCRQWAAVVERTSLAKSVRKEPDSRRMRRTFASVRRSFASRQAKCCSACSADSQGRRNEQGAEPRSYPEPSHC